MRRIPWIVLALAVVGAVLATGVAGATTLLQMDLATMAGNAGPIFTGTLTNITESSIPAGGTTLPTTIYTFEVSEVLKGTITTEKDRQFYRLQMVGSLKRRFLEPKGSVARVDVLPQPPRLRLGQSYLILATPPSAIGLSTTVGLGGGCFTLYEDDKTLMAVNEFGNLGLFPGPVTYRELVDAIRASLGS